MVTEYFLTFPVFSFGKLFFQCEFKHVVTALQEDVIKGRDEENWF